jgi:hypothetical protein
MKTGSIRRGLTSLIFVIMGVAVVHSSLRAEDVSSVAYRTVTIDDVDIFYREAGDPDRPTILLLHGFPTSSHMFRNLIPALADQYHLLDTGHFALESHGREIADLMRNFLDRKLVNSTVAVN